MGSCMSRSGTSLSSIKDIEPKREERLANSLKNNYTSIMVERIFVELTIAYNAGVPKPTMIYPISDQDDVKNIISRLVERFKRYGIDVNVDVADFFFICIHDTCFNESGNGQTLCCSNQKESGESGNILNDSGHYQKESGSVQSRNTLPQSTHHIDPLICDRDISDYQIV